MKVNKMTLAGFIACLFLANNAYAKQKFIIAYNEYPPYMARALPSEGLLNHIVKKSFALRDIDVELKAMSPTRIFKLIKSGQLVASVGWSHTVKRENFAVFSEPLYSTSTVLFYHQDKPISWFNMTHMTVGVTKTYFYGQEFNQLVKDKVFRTQEAVSDEVNFRKLLGKRINAFPVSLAVGKHLLSQHFTKEQQDKIAYAPTIIDSDDLSIMFSKKSTDYQYLMEQFKQGFSMLKKSGRYEKMIQKFDANFK